MRELEKLLLRSLYRKSFYDFVKDFWYTADPSRFIDGRVIKIYCEIFQFMCRDWVGYTPVEITAPVPDDKTDVIDVRQDKHNICIAVPPRHTKSMIFNVFGPVWLWINHPIKAVSISHTGQLATQMNSKRYAIINSEKFRELFSDIVLVTNSASFLKDDRGGELYSLNRNAFTGYGGDVIINDDLTNAEAARKDQAEMANAWSYYQTTMPSRINDPSRCIIMNIQQRLAPNDITGHILADPNLASTYIFVTLPAQFQRKTHVVLPISGEIVTFEKGEYLWPERFGDYKSIRLQVGENIFRTQYLQDPVNSDRSVIKADSLRTAAENEVPGIDQADIIYASHDFPVKDKETSDFLGSVLAYRVGANLYVKDCLEKRMAFVRSVEYVRQLDDAFPGIVQIIEDKANGSPILQQLQDTVAGLQAFNPGTSSKMQRLESASVYTDAGNVILVKTKWNELTQTYEFTPAMKNLYDRLLAFPFVEHDDIVDAFSMLVMFVFIDKRYAVYGRTFGERNVIRADKERTDYTGVFFTKDGDLWRILEIGVQYAEQNKIVVLREEKLKTSLEGAIRKLKDFAPGKKVFFNCSPEPISNVVAKDAMIEQYGVEDFERSVNQLNLAFSQGRVLIDRECVQTRADIENFKYSKTKDENAVKFQTENDGFVRCIRTAIEYFGGFY